MNASLDEITLLHNKHDALKKELELLNAELSTKHNVLSGFKQQILVIGEQENLHKQTISDLQGSEHDIMLNNKLKQLQKESEQIEAAFEIELSVQDKEIDNLQRELKEINEVEEVPVVDNSSEDFLEESFNLEQSINDLKTNLFDKSLLMDELQFQNYRLIESRHNLKEEMEVITENIRTKEDDVIKANDNFLTLEEESAVMKSELHILRGQSLAPIKQESIFSEVNDRRVSLKDALAEEERSYKQKQLQILELSKKAATLNCDHNELKNALQNDKMEIQQNYKSVIDIYKNRERALRKLIGVFKDVVDQKIGLYKYRTTEDTMKFIDNLIKEKEKIELDLKGIISPEYVSEKMLFLYLKEINTKICEVKSSLKQLEKKVSELKKVEDSPVSADRTNQPDQVLIEKHKNAKKVGGSKKVTYAEGTVDSKPSSNQGRRGKVLQSETVFFV